MKYVPPRELLSFTFLDIKIFEYFPVVESVVRLKIVSVLLIALFVLFGVIMERVLK